jgi:PAS domain S-box-containing protein
MNPQGLHLFFVMVLAGLLAVALFSVLRFFAATRAARDRMRSAGSESAFLSGALQDAVRRLKAQEQEMRTRAHASEALSHHIVDSLSAGLLVVDLSGEVKTINPAGQRLLGLEDGVVVGGYQALNDVHPELTALVRACLTDGATAPLHDIIVNRVAGPVHLSVSVSPLTTNGLQVGAVCLMTDVTPLRELEEQLRLKEALARVGELTAGIAHEFRNGLATIHGYSRLLKPDALPEVYRPYVEGIRDEAESLGQVVTRFLRFARPEEVELTPVDLRAVARKAADDLATELSSDVDLAVEGQFDVVEGDEVLLRQVFDNLIRNATEACASKGVGPVVRIIGEVDERTCRISVEDNGPGIPDEARSRVFEPFFTTRSRGTGLGLAIVLKVVVTLNGRVAVGRSSLGGAAIQLTLPRAGRRFEIPAA